MILLPAIDLMNGEVVRLQRGLASQKTVYSNDPVAFAKKWEDAGADWLHLVDLDAAFHGESRNLETVARICSAVRVPCELGGGMRTRESMAAAFDAGVSRVILGTRACQSPGTLLDFASEFGGDRLAVGIDAKDGLVAVNGWTETTDVLAVDLARQAVDAGIRTIISTDIATDGMLQGPNFAELEKMLTSCDCRLIASGGVSCEEDVRRLNLIPGLHGVIIGKALYDGRITGDLRRLLETV